MITDFLFSMQGVLLLSNLLCTYAHLHMIT